MSPALLDRVLDFTILPGYSGIGFALRKLRWKDPVASTLEDRVVHAGPRLRPRRAGGITNRVVCAGRPRQYRDRALRPLGP
jgi:hypothetical protein